MRLDVRTYIILTILSATCASLNTHIAIEFAIIAALAVLQLFSAKGSFMPKLVICYMVMTFIQFVLFPVLPETVEMVLSLPVVNIRSFFPTIMCIVLLYKNTRVSEMAASFTKMGVKKSVVIPIAVAVRYIPTLKEEWLHIRDAMRMRNVTAGIKNPFRRLVCRMECYLVPLFVSSIQSADELSAAAVTRGIDNPTKPTCRGYRKMGFRDYVALCIAFAVTFACAFDIYGRLC